jgi:signal transduction histidine kinase
MNYADKLLLRYWVEPIVLRESIRARVVVAPTTMVLVLLAFAVSLPYLVTLGVTFSRIVLWSAPVLLLLAARGGVSRWIHHRLDDFSTLELLGADRILRISSIVTQATVGMGIWIVRSASDEHLVVALFMTLLMICWSVGVLANLFSDLPSFIASIPIMFGATAVYWIWQGGFGVSVGVSLLLAMALMIMLVHRGSAIFRSSVMMRFEKDQLLEQIKDQRLETMKALREAQEANQSRAYFMAAAAHDVKQPLHALALLTDTLLLSDPQASTVRILQQQRASIDQMSDYFDALMDMRSFLKGDYEQHIVSFRLTRLGAHLESEFAPLCAGKGLTWSLEFEDLLVLTDYQLLLRLFRNLLSNAVRYTNYGKVGCSAKAIGDVVEFLVSDTGIGIAAEYHDVVFEDFVRLKTEGLDPAGSGLGLSIVKKMSQALGLNLQMSSAAGEGTRFSFRLPIAGES